MWRWTFKKTTHIFEFWEVLKTKTHAHRLRKILPYVTLPLGRYAWSTKCRNRQPSTKRRSSFIPALLVFPRRVTKTDAAWLGPCETIPGNVTGPTTSIACHILPAVAPVCSAGYFPWPGRHYEVGWKVYSFEPQARGKRGQSVNSSQFRTKEVSEKKVCG